MKESRILCLIRGREKFIKPLTNISEFEIIIESNWEDYIIDKYNPDLIISIGESHFEVFKCFKKAKSLGIPTLNIQDGIHEWRDIWENDKYAKGGNYFNRQFIIADKIACIGQLQADWYHAMGMTGQPEVVGMPWLEDFIQNDDKWKRREGIKNIMVMTANTPAFNLEQYRLVLESIQDLKNSTAVAKDNLLVWRVRGNLRRDLNLINEDPKYETESLHKILPQVDGVICTPSTAIIESMVAGVPTALIDYTNSPLFINTAWRINCQAQIAQTISELLDPPENKLNFQNMALSMMAYTKPKSDQRLVVLVEKMILYGRIARKLNIPLILPNKLLDDCEIAIKVPEFNKTSLFPYHSVFHKDNLLSLQIENNYLEIENRSLKEKVMMRSVYYDLKKLVKRLKKWN